MVVPETTIIYIQVMPEFWGSNADIDIANPNATEHQIRLWELWVVKDMHLMNRKTACSVQGLYLYFNVCMVFIQ